MRRRRLPERKYLIAAPARDARREVAAGLLGSGRKVFENSSVMPRVYPSGNEKGPAAISEYSETVNTVAFRVTVPAGSPALVATSLTNDGGWTASDEGGRRRPNLRHAPFLALSLPPGEHGSSSGICRPAFAREPSSPGRRSSRPRSPSRPRGGGAPLERRPLFAVAPSRLWRCRDAMREDWNLRARANAPFYVCTTAADSPAAFASSGQSTSRRTFLRPHSRRGGARSRSGAASEGSSARSAVASRASWGSTFPPRCSPARATPARIRNVELRADRRRPGLPSGRRVRLRVLAHRVPAPSPQGVCGALLPGRVPGPGAGGRLPGPGRRPLATVLSPLDRGLLVRRGFFGARSSAPGGRRVGFRVVEIRGEGTQYLRATAVKPG